MCVSITSLWTPPDFRVLPSVPRDLCLSVVIGPTCYGLAFSSTTTLLNGAIEHQTLGYYRHGLVDKHDCHFSGDSVTV